MSTSTDRRRRRLSAEQRRDQLIAATVQVVAQVGFQAASADAIAKQAGVSKGLLWNYFDDLRDLMATTARQVLAAVGTDVGAAVDLSAPVPELLQATIRRAAQLPTTHGPQLRALREIALNLRDEDGRPQLEEGEYEQLYTGQEAIFRRGQQDGDIRAGIDPRLLAISYQSLVDGMLTHLHSHPELDAEAYAAFIADLLLDGIRA